jgi:GTP-binding protein EngB required for normal cell division
MSQVIIHANSNGGVSVTVPTNELPINEVLAKDCPAGAIIVDSSTLPQGADAQFFDAWELSGSTVSVNFTKAQAIKLAQFNAAAVQVAQKRQLNTLASIANTPDDATFTTELTNGRTAIAAATTTAQLVAIANPV